ncbi:MAG: hypothetical protein H7A47_05695 [Verrucomicrobiales bacterium]|nr:hypothetical protein [Verrucomicrobiales bacterium]
MNALTRRCHLFAAGLLLFPALGPGAASERPSRLKRADSFLGVHFDFHAGPDCTEIGRNTTPEMVASVIRQIGPDYLQIDCKGHPGLSSYPTRVGHRAPGFVGDPLRVWREETARHGVALYLHYSGVWDSEAIRLHPAWAARQADGQPVWNATSFFSPYADALLIPQLRELAGEYGVDGAWVDGECWASRADYGEATTAAFRERTGFDTVPRGRGEPHWFEWLEFNRDLFRGYLRHYIAEVKRIHPEFQICSNWAFTDHMPEPVCAPVDFLSGDYSPEDSVNSARLSGRFLVRQGLPWDLMAWSFTRKPGANGSNLKTAVQLQREAAVVVALGGGFQAYFQQRRDGSVDTERLAVMAEVARFCRERQGLCHHAEPVPQVGLIFSTAAHYRLINGLFSRDLARISGVLQALLESQYSVEVVAEHQLANRLGEYPLLVVPEWEYLDPGFRRDLLRYVEQGGSLLLIGPGSAALFAEPLGVRLAGSVSARQTLRLERAGASVELEGESQRVDLGPEAVPFGELRATDAPHADRQVAASWTRLGRGRIGATYFTLGRGYLAGRDAGLRGFLAAFVGKLFPDPMVEITGSPGVDVSLARHNGRLLVNLVNTSGPHQTEPIIESIPPVGPLEVRVRGVGRPSRITLEPGGKALPFAIEGDHVRLQVPEFAIHRTIVITTE